MQTAGGLLSVADAEAALTQLLGSPAAIVQLDAEASHPSAPSQPARIKTPMQPCCMGLALQSAHLGPALSCLSAARPLARPLPTRCLSAACPLPIRCLYCRHVGAIAALQAQQGYLAAALTRCSSCPSGRLGSHAIASDRIGSHPIASDRIRSHRIASDRIGSHPITSDRIRSPRIASDRIGSHPIASNRIGSHRTASSAVVLCGGGLRSTWRRRGATRPPSLRPRAVRIALDRIDSHLIGSSRIRCGPGIASDRIEPHLIGSSRIRCGPRRTWRRRGATWPPSLRRWAKPSAERSW